MLIYLGKGKIANIDEFGVKSRITVVTPENGEYLLMFHGIVHHYSFRKEADPQRGCIGAIECETIGELLQLILFHTPNAVFYEDGIEFALTKVDATIIQTDNINTIESELEAVKKVIVGMLTQHDDS